MSQPVLSPGIYQADNGGGTLTFKFFPNVSLSSSLINKAEAANAFK